MAAITETDASADVGWLDGRTPSGLRAVLISLALLEAGAIIAQAGTLAWIADAAFIDRVPIAALVPALLLLLAVFALRALVQGARQWRVADASVALRREVRGELMSALKRPDLSGREASGQLVPLVDEQVMLLDRYYGRFLPQRLNAMLIPPLVLLAVLTADWFAAALLALTAPLIPLFMILIGKGAGAQARRQQNRLAHLSGWFLDRVRGAATLRLFRAESRTLEQVRQRTDALRRETMKVLKLAFLSSAVLEFFSAVAIASIAMYVGLGLFGALTLGPSGQLTLFSGLFVLLLAPEFFQPLRALAQGWHERADAVAAAGAIRSRLAHAPALDSSRGSIAPAPPQASRIALRDLRFGYPERAVLIRDLSLDIMAGERIVLTGPSGGGKSTLIGLLAGFLQPQHGEVRIDGQPLAKFTDAARAAHIGWLGQRPWLIAGSIEDNLRLGDTEASSKTLARAVALARVDEFLDRLPEGLATPVGEGGVALSGGQAQRIALARVLLRPRPVLLLDEPTASLDPDGEEDVLEALRQSLAARPATVICASHRPALLDWAGRVIELGEGRMVEVRS